jgi:hypothetical protein
MKVICKIFSGIQGLLSVLWNGCALIFLLAVVATIPILQLASLGYMLESSSRVARGMPANRCFPGASIAGGILSCGLWIGVTWLPVWLLADLAYSAELIEPGSGRASQFRIAARIAAVVWVLWSAWAMLRGGRWWHFLWPSPIVFIKTILRPAAWRRAEDQWWSWIASLQLPHLWTLGLQGAIAALAWLVLPAGLMIFALTSPDRGPSGFLGLAGALGMIWVLMYLPFLPIHMAAKRRFLAAWDRRSIQRAFRRAPFAFLFAVLALVVLALPLYPLRIEVIPAELWWILSLLFVAMIFPAKLAAGWALRRSHHPSNESHWILRWLAWIPLVAILGLYVGFLYVAKFALWEGTASILLQHAFLPPVPFYGR